MMFYLLKVYQTALKTHPIFVQAAQTAFLMSSGDVIAQFCTEKRRLHNYDFRRTFNFFVAGFFIVGPSIRIWYGVLDQKIGNKTKLCVIKKLALDQICFAPCLIGVLLFVLKKLDGYRNPEVYQYMRHHYFDLLKSNYMLWPWVQLCNFAFVPLNYQALLVQTVALFWNVYFSWKTNQKSIVAQSKQQLID